MRALSHVGWAELHKVSLPQGHAMEKLHLPSVQVTGHGSALERRREGATTPRNTRNTLCPQPRGVQPTSGRVRSGQHSHRSSAISMEEGLNPVPSPTSRARLEFWSLRGLTSQQVQKLRSGRCPAWHGFVTSEQTVGA